jgi:VWFA-related protein
LAPSGPSDDTPALLRVDSSLVLIPVRVTTVTGSPVAGLQKENFAVFEDGLRQNITEFARDDAPVSVGVILDTSGSMKNKMEKVEEAAAVFFQSANPEDEFFLIECGGRARLKIPFTPDWRSVYSEMLRARPTGLTSLLDGLSLALAHIKTARNARKAIVILSDGGDNFSRRSLRQLKNDLVESGVQVYALGIFDANYRVKHTPEERRGPELLDEVTLETGGRHFPVLKGDELASIGARMARDLRDQYILGYSPADSARDGRYHHIRLRLELKDDAGDLRTDYRQGYYAPER